MLESRLSTSMIARSSKMRSARERMIGSVWPCLRQNASACAKVNAAIEARIHSCVLMCQDCKSAWRSHCNRALEELNFITSWCEVRIVASFNPLTRFYAWKAYDLSGSNKKFFPPTSSKITEPSKRNSYPGPVFYVWLFQLALETQSTRVIYEVEYDLSSELQIESTNRGYA
jgi:hypothetical protein